MPEYSNKLNSRWTIRSWLRLVLMLLGVVFLFILLRRNWQNFVAILPQINYVILALSIVLGVMTNWVIAILFRLLLFKYTCEVALNTVRRLFLIGQIAKYIPGKIWSMVLQRSYLQGTHATSAVIFSNLDLMAISIITVSSACLSFILLDLSIVLSIVVLIGGALVLSLVCNRCFIKAIIASIPFIKQKILQSVQCQPLQGAKPVLVSLLAFWILYLGSNFVLLQAVFNYSPLVSLQYVGLLGLSWVIGALIFLFPAGMGVREAVFILLAQWVVPDVSLSELANIALIARFWQILIDALSMLSVFVFPQFASPPLLEQRK